MRGSKFHLDLTIGLYTSLSEDATEMSVIAIMFTHTFVILCTYILAIKCSSLFACTICVYSCIGGRGGHNTVVARTQQSTEVMLSVTSKISSGHFYRSVESDEISSIQLNTFEMPSLQVLICGTK